MPMVAKKSSNSTILIAVVAVISLAAGLYVGAGFYSPQIAEQVRDVIYEKYSMDNSDFTPGEIELDGTHLTIKSGCTGIGFDVTEDQAFSIGRALGNEAAPRPLTHDILQDVMENFNMTVLAIRIERWGEEIYYARMFVQQGGNVLDIDMRPSDAVALALRLKQPLLVNRTMLDERGGNVC